MNPQLIIAAIIAAASFGGGFGAAWKIQNGIAAEKEKQHVQQTLRATQEAASRDIRNLDNVIAAQNAATVRDRRLRLDAAGSRSALVSLSHAADAALRSAEADHATCIVRANSLAIVLKELGRSGGELAEKADKHTNDVQSCRDSVTQ